VHFHVKARIELQEFPEDVRRELGKAISKRVEKIEKSKSA